MENIFDSQENSISLLIEKWNEIYPILKNAFEQRELSQVSRQMENGMQLFIEFLFRSNGKSVQPSLNAEMLDFYPVNFQERIQFVKSRPTSYHAFIQLSELFREHEKLYAKNIALKKASKHKTV
ncbi:MULTISPECIES: YpoC family protein [unclassified Bacillus (in: firmicutes)]|uniref:YpoC family protein n=1 Tax=unclassified Bacillus (in: firmicutes) TaxID=185979 RepID=UPI0008E7A6E9|nr:MULTISPECIES: hypothetical protein [unclassified Bacillus (in: firmicutes)]SFA98892.1 hypothetical protein SAMN02799634_103392 [Bacillus sp. UNCCL13]SFQ81343.1 hypothetical protein SAMN04488577_2021 [Bacillus sp. cl95]